MSLLAAPNPIMVLVSSNVLEFWLRIFILVESWKIWSRGETYGVLNLLGGVNGICSRS
jgi:hypothetical protein